MRPWRTGTRCSPTKRLPDCYRLLKVPRDSSTRRPSPSTAIVQANNGEIDRIRLRKYPYSRQCNDVTKSPDTEELPSRNGRRRVLESPPLPQAMKKAPLKGPFSLLAERGGLFAACGGSPLRGHRASRDVLSPPSAPLRVASGGPESNQGFSSSRL